MEIEHINRYKLIIAFVFLISFVFVGRLFYLQILKGSVYKIKAETQSIKAQHIYPFRGNIYDRDGNLLVYNAPSFSLQVYIGNFRKDRINILAHLLNIDSTELYKLILKNFKYSQFGDIKILKDLDYQTVQKIEENLEYLPGVEIVPESKRMYNPSIRMSHVIGYLQEISFDELKDQPFYSVGDLVGRTGLEKTYETELRGEKGKRFVGILPAGVRTVRFNEGKSDMPVKNGDDLLLSIDTKLQAKAEELLSDWRGAIVAIDPNNGEVLALASKPDYDISLLSGKQFSQNYNLLDNHPSKPLINRAIQSRYPPGSTWKPLMAIAALEEGVINTNTSFYCPGNFQFGNHIYGCHGSHGYVDVITAIKVSCNVFFYQTALKLGLERIAKWGTLFGFGKKTGIDLPFENSGILPNREWLMRRYGNWIPPGAVVNYGIGQGEINVTPLQLASYVATISNGGTYHQPHLVRAIRNSITKQTSLMSYDSRKINISPKTIEIVKKAMFEVVNVPGGTAYGIKIDNLEICGKTGTAQNTKGKDHSWFICFAPKDNPKIALAVIVENAGFGSAVAAPIARELLQTFFNLQNAQSVADTTNLVAD
ncbi:MAG: penicillin-binding protein 2 [Candidatus Kapaibacteriales bacterium]